MSMSVQIRGNKAQLRVRDRLLPRPYFRTFDTEAEARSHGEQLQALLAAGIVPAELANEEPRGADDPLLIEVIRAYTKAAPLTDSDDVLLTQMMAELVGLRVSRMTFDWAQLYVRKLKVQHNLAPSTIRKRVGVLGRVMDWHLRMSARGGQVPMANVLRLLPRGYSAYSKTDAAALVAAKGEAGQVKRDVARDRRLHVDEEQRIRRALAGEKREDRERALEDAGGELAMLFDLILDTGLRLREAYTLRRDQVDLQRRLLLVDGSKGHRGEIKPRTVPIKAQLLERLQAFLRRRVGRLVFSFWDGTPEGLRKATNRLSARYSVLFEYAQVPDFTEHDLRHEATCRWVELRDKAGRWAFSDIEICRVMGWTDTRMMLRYASLRGEDLVARLG